MGARIEVRDQFDLAMSLRYACSLLGGKYQFTNGIVTITEDGYNWLVGGQGFPVHGLLYLYLEDALKENANV